MTIGSQVKQSLASVKSIEAILSSLTVQSEDKTAKKAFDESRVLAARVAEDLQKRVGELEREEAQYKGF
ncbi:uncharacterized protein DUF1657 [Scopulibacillus darangshiensis]|uniref:Uncharacterized protein DUF1657 n=1 Tax=Scopulibacillus darangshiensis TaxID=442528 RepID=A0A4R2PA15_9BACL|nr:DUF1657 domain-containing protein [Scopulibacillus darangshiensis]TCP31777.1 uncharacterized protein DUF1657 [Scopulibacillus darangshiensis]